MKKTNFLQTTVTAMMILSFVFAPIAATRSFTATAATAMMARRYWSWQVTIQGTVYGRPFQRQGTLYLTDPFSSAGTINGANPIEIGLFSGSPITSPQIGAIQFVTNSGLLGSSRGGRAQLDLAYVRFNSSAGKVEVQPDQRLAANAGANVFNASTGIQANLYQVYDGQLQLQFQNDYQNITGVVNFVGTGFIEPAAAPYQAKITGRFAGSGTF